MNQLKFLIFSVFYLVMVASSTVVHALPGQPAFSLHNKFKKTIRVVLKHAGDTPKYNGPVTNDSFLISNDISNTKRTVYLLIYLDDNSAPLIFQFSANKDIYVNFNGKKLYPQRGPKMGATGKTDQGYLTDNNVKEKDIIQLGDISQIN